MEHFEFDPKKSRLNKEQHGVDLQWAQCMWDETHVITPAKFVRGENRWLILAKVDDKCYPAVFTRRGEAIRLMSCHRVGGRLERIYENHVQNQKDKTN